MKCSVIYINCEVVDTQYRILPIWPDTSIKRSP